MARRQRPRPLKQLLSTANSAAGNANSAAIKANDLLDAIAREMDEVFDILDDPQEVGEYIYEVVKGVIRAAKADQTSDEQADVMKAVLMLGRAILKKTT